MPIRRALGGDDHVAAGHQSGVAGEGAAVDDGDQRHQRAELRIRGERVRIDGDARTDIVLAGPSAAALAEQHQRQAEPLASSNMRSCL